MNISGIGVQQILPQSGTPQQTANPPEVRNNDTGGDDAAAVQPPLPPPPPGTGQIVDRSV